MHPGALEIKFYWVSFFQEKMVLIQFFFHLWPGNFLFQGRKKEHTFPVN